VTREADPIVNIGLVITVGLSIGTLFTLFVVPVMYSLIAKPYSRPVETGFT